MTETTDDAFFNGALVLRQLAKGHRIGTDAVLLAAACPAGAARIADLGCGVGAVGLRAAQMHPGAHVALIDNDPAVLALASANITHNRLEGRCAVIAADVFGKGFAAPATAGGRFSVVLTNPPFAEAGTQRVSPVAAKARAHVLSGPLDSWIKAAAGLLAPKGEIVLIHRADALAALLAGLQRRFGGAQVLFVHPRADAPAHRVLIRARLGSRAPLQVAPPLVLHGADGAFTPAADRLHRGGAAIGWNQHTR